MTPIEAHKKINEKLVFSNLYYKRGKRKLHFHLGQSNRTTDKKTFSEKVKVGNGDIY